MKKIIKPSVSMLCTVILFVILLFCSCNTTVKTTLEFNEEEANEAMEVVLTKSIRAANTRFFQKLANYSFLPYQYSLLKTQEDNIPGMSMLIQSWNKYVTDFIEKHHSEIEIKTNNFVKELKIINGMELVNSTNTSGTYYLESVAKDSFLSLIESIVGKMDFSILNNAVSQYNSWVVSQNYMKNLNYRKIETINPSKELIDKIYGIYRDNLALYEEMYRTAPDPYAEDILVKVFGI